jgi:stage V sporulation protein AC
MFNTKEYYIKITKEKYDFKELLKNFLHAFIAGGIVCVIGQSLIDIYSNFVDKQQAILYMTMTVIIIVGILTAIGIYDNIGQLCKCGLSIPLSGFINATVSSALEYKKEGLVLGIGSNIFKLSGSVLALGSSAAIIVATIRYIFWVIR